MQQPPPPIQGHCTLTKAFLILRNSLKDELYYHSLCAHILTFEGTVEDQFVGSPPPPRSQLDDHLALATKILTPPATNARISVTPCIGDSV
ncbi:hypothetical protein L596_012641 [Steinernema carpocapsae]|uniref:Uncharacterized protein n=1 Tax=Steinernema carpocapsae TaxID=34508 RepID=A0A4U5NXQ1_STECR|nr:hypothetical protein L596_012641 [Steinernema carpocapsae]